MEDIIYILIGIAWIGFSIYSQQKKLKKKQQEAAARRSDQSQQDEAEEPETAEKSLFDKLFEDFQEETSFEPAEEAWRKQAAREAAQPTGRFDSVEQAKSRQEITESNSELSSVYYKLEQKSKTEKEKHRREPVPDNVLEEENDYDEKRQWDFDLRKAVIYSAILERPYD